MQTFGRARSTLQRNLLPFVQKKRKSGSSKSPCADSKSARSIQWEISLLPKTLKGRKGKSKKRRTVVEKDQKRNRNRIKETEPEQHLWGALQDSQLRSCLTCPITKKIFVDPVILNDGNSFERSAFDRKLHTSKSGTASSSKNRTESVSNVLLRQISAQFVTPLPPNLSVENWSDSIDENLECCVTLEPFSDPIVLSDGHTYERSAAEKWLATAGKGPTSPITGMELQKPAFLAPNKALHQFVAEWRRLTKSS